ncbi:MAG TPA: MEDS domain-containing protein [Streptosporangiaceae bacterium]|nr:MEDS domain-containing protein [Streptosporangiaceae bacterium]
MTAEIPEGRPGTHAVVFYHDHELAGVVGDYLVRAINDGGVAIIVATPQHRLWVNGWLMQSGIDLAAACAGGSYVVLDASQTLARFLRGGWPDPSAFWSEIGSVLSSAARRKHGPICVFGEMVGLLWDGGNFGAAVELEALWNELAGQYPFALLCGYRHASVSASRDSDALAQVCFAHSQAVGLPSPA